MAKRPAPEAPPDRIWDIYHVTGTPAKLVGSVRAPTADEAVKRACEAFNITPRGRWRLIAKAR